MVCPFLGNFSCFGPSGFWVLLNSIKPQNPFWSWEFGIWDILVFFFF